MQNIHVKRYEDASAGYQGSVEPEDRSWVLFIATDGTPSLWRRVEAEADDGTMQHAYAPAALVEPVEAIAQ